VLNFFDKRPPVEVGFGTGGWALVRSLAVVCAVVSSVSAQDCPCPSSSTRWAFDGGLGIRLWDLSGESAEQREYLQQGRVGSITGLDVSVYPWQPFGVGLVHAWFHATASEQNMLFADSSRGPARDVYEVHHVGPAFFIAHPLAGGRLTVVGQTGIGWLFYRNESKTGQFPGILEGHTWGLHAGASVDYRIAPWVGIGLGVRALYGTLDGVQYNVMETTIPPLSLSRFDFIAGIRFYP
jgi:hypothetical protein